MGRSRYGINNPRFACYLCIMGILNSNAYELVKPM